MSLGVHSGAGVRRSLLNLELLHITALAQLIIACMIFSLSLTMIHHSSIAIS
jgi:hypothetical protein